MKITLDMNLSPAWVPFLVQAGHSAVHWSSVGPPEATDHEILKQVLEDNRILFTHDLDFGAILAATEACSPSVIQVRTEDPTPDSCGGLVLAVLRQYEEALAAGALISIDETRARIRILPVKRAGD